MSATRLAWQSIRDNILSCALILLVGTMVYGDHLKNPFQYDSVHYITDNPELRHPENVATLEFFKREYFSRALMTISIAWNALLGGMNPYGYHLLNLTFHLLNAVLIFFIAMRASGYFQLQRFGMTLTDFRVLSLTSALLFTIHPIQTESVLDIMGRSEVLSATFYLAGVLLFQVGLHDRAGAVWRYVLMPVGIFAVLFLGYSVKQTLITLPAVLLIYYLCGRTPDSLPIRILQKGKWIFLAIACIGLALLLQKLLSDERFLVGPTPVEKMVGRKAYMLSQPSALMFYYLKLLLVPANLNIDPDIPLVGGIYSIRFILPAILISLAVYFAFTAKSSRIWFFFVAWFFIVISPSSSIITLQDLAAEHRVYLSAQGFFILLALGLMLLKIQAGENKAGNGLRVVACVVIMIFMCGLTIKRCAAWRSEMALWDDARRKSPAKDRPLANIGRSYALAGDIKRAVLFYEQSVAKNPRIFETRYNLGDLYFRSGRVAEALQHIQIAAELEPRIPETFGRLGEIHMELKQYELADEYLRKAVELNPQYATALRNLGVVNYYYLKDRKKQALAYFSRALELNPEQTDAHLIRRLLEAGVDK
jgi:tetratricopeptide (TPR) repeat protein